MIDKPESVTGMTIDNITNELSFIIADRELLPEQKGVIFVQNIQSVQASNGNQNLEELFKVYIYRLADFLVTMAFLQ